MPFKRNDKRLETVSGELSDAVVKKRSDIIEFLQQLIKIPSVIQSGPAERRAQELIADRLEKIGCSIDMWFPKIDRLKTHPAFVPVEGDYKNRPIVAARLKGCDKGRSVILNGHTEVVPPGSLSEWQFDPWNGAVEENKVFGRGAADMKGGIASMIMALEILVESGISLNGDVILQSVLDEEIGGNGTLACILRGYKADGAIIAEPTNLEIHPAHRGGRVFDITVEGKAAHVGFKFEGVDALDKAVKVIEATKKFEELRNKERSSGLFNRYPIQVPVLIGVINGGEWPCTVPGEVLLKGTIECLPGEDIKEVAETFEEYISKVAGRDSWMKTHKPRFNWASLCIESSEVDVRSPLVKALSEAYRETTGKNSTYAGFPGGCDMRLLVRYGSTPTVIFGPGALREAHSANESVQIDNLLTSTKVFLRFLINWAGIHK